MAVLTLNLPDELLRDLRRVAAHNHRSLNQQAIHLLEAALRGGLRRVGGADAQVGAWRQLAGRWASSVDRKTEAQRLMKRRSLARKIAL